MNDPNRTVRDWTEEDEKKYREMLRTPVKKITEEELLKLAAVSPYPPLGACREKPQVNENDKTPMFGNNDNFAKEITEAGIKAAKATHEFNMREIKAKLIADICTELVKTPIRHEDVPKIAREIAENALENI